MTSVSTDRRLGVNSGAAVKVPCRAASTVNLTLSGEQTIDGIACVTGDRVLVKNQTSGADNGIYIVDTGTWGRAPDWDGAYDVVTGTLVLVNSGTTNAHTGWQVTTTGTITVGTTSVSFTNAFLSDSASVSFVPPGTGAVTESMQAMGRRIVWANQYGSQMATTPGADVNAAITALGSSGGIVYIAPGNYTIETSILQPSNVTIRGCGIGVTKLTAKLGLNSPVIKNATAFTSQVITITRTGRTATATKTAHGYSTGTWVFINGAVQIPYNGVFKIFNVTANTFDFYVEQTTTSPATGTIRVYQACETSLAVENLEIVGNSANTSGTNYGIAYHGVENFRITDVYSHGCYHSQVALVSAANGTLTRVRADETVSATSPAIVCGTGTVGAGGGISYCFNLLLESCEAHKNQQTGLELEFGRGAIVNNFRGTGNVLAGGLTTSTYSQVVINAAVCRLNTTGIELFLNGGATDVTVSNCICEENGGAGIHVTNADTVNTAKRIALLGNNCSFNAQDSGASEVNGINVHPAVGATIDGLEIHNNTLNNNGRGLSFHADGTTKNVSAYGNKITGNVVDFFRDVTGLEVATFKSDIPLPFTPALKFGGLAVGMTYADRVASFTRVGGRCRGQIYLALSAKGSSVGAATITGMPTTSKNLASTYATGAVRADTVTFAGYVSHLIAPNTATLTLGDCATGAAFAALTDAAFTNASALIINFDYETDA